MGESHHNQLEAAGRHVGSTPFVPVRQVTNPIEHAQALWPGLLSGKPQGTKSIWPTPHHKDPDRLVDTMIYVRYQEGTENQMADLDATNSYLKSLCGLPDKYISLNTFTGRRVHANLRCLTGLVVDLDLCKTSYGTDFMAMRQDALDAISSAGIPCPTMAVHTGRGVHLYWLFDRFVPAMAFPRWRACTSRLISLLRPFGADPSVRDTARVLRLVGTRNSKAICVNPDDGSKHFWKVSAEVFRAERHAFDFLADQILPFTRQDLEQRRSNVATSGSEPAALQASKRVRHWTASGKATGFRDIAIARQGDIDLLARTLYPLEVPTGLRDTFLFHTACNLCWIHTGHALKDELMKWRDSYVPSVNNEELLASMGSALRRAKSSNDIQASKFTNVYEDDRYVYSADRLWEIFGSQITAANLQAQMQAILPRAERQERAKAKKKSARQAKQETTYTGQGVRTCNLPLAKQAHELRDGGLTLRKIAQALGKAPKTIKKWLELPLQALSVDQVEMTAQLAVPSPSPLPPQLAPQPDPSYPQGNAEPRVLPKRATNNGVALEVLKKMVFDQTRQPNLKGKVSGEEEILVKNSIQRVAGRGPAHTDPQLLVKLRKLPAYVALSRAGLFPKPDLSFKAKLNSTTASCHVTLPNGGTIEVIHTGRMWFIRDEKFGGGSSVDLILHLTKLKFKDVINLLRVEGE